MFAQSVGGGDTSSKWNNLFTSTESNWKISVEKQNSAKCTIELKINITVYENSINKYVWFQKKMFWKREMSIH